MNPDIEAYISELSANLQGLPEEERQDTEEFYREYLLDGNLDSRLAIEQKLGTPQQLARKILADYSVNIDNAHYPKKINPQQSHHDLRAIWWIILGMLAVPIGFPILIALGAIILATICVIGGLLIGFWGLIVSLIIGGVMLLVKALVLLGTQWPVGLFYGGWGLIILAITALIIPALFQFMQFIIAASGRLIRRLGHQVFKKQYYQTANKEKHQQ
ncbi:DUF1700 domain-containing protein [Bombilactobacillus bombi]|uniref:DUF1700 domain-containing protein n=1 Tax=Bombilactobacillus bombi TaxID=1303590 RepID=UPI0015E5E251|nr:DUF1700 domain-containing protein [Bombilactobacillus bombi]MBA1434795.1 DUF1700 domain-containing protein [Bombilactobacillus bombi]